MASNPWSPEIKSWINREWLVDFTVLLREKVKLLENLRKVSPCG